MRLLVSACVVGLLAAPTDSGAQDSNRPSGKTGSPSGAAQQRSVAPGQRPLTIFSVASNTFDSNINHDLDEVRTLGVVLGTGAQFRNNPSNPSIDVTYTMALHRYTGTDRWDRLSHHVRALVERDLPGRWSWGTVGEVSLKGTSEDRELSNQYVVSPRLDYRLGDSHRLRTYGAVRLKRHEQDIGRNATNRYLGAELVQRSPRGDRWGLGARLEGNDAISDRHDYNRWTYYAEYVAPIYDRDQIEFELKTRLQRYRHRLVEVDDRDVPRRDQRWIPSFTWVRRLAPAADLRLGYEFETRASNDPDKGFSAHQFTASVVRRWW